MQGFRGLSSGLSFVMLATSLASCGHDAREEPRPHLLALPPFTPTPPKKAEPKKPVEERAPRKPNPADGKCERATVSSGIVDPDCVYLVGSVTNEYLAEVLIDPFHPEDRASGFGFFKRIMIHPTTGEIWFHSIDEAHKLMGVYVHQTNAPGLTPLAAQQSIPVPVCPGDFHDPWDFGLFADDGALAIQCVDGRLLVPPESKPFDDRFWEYHALGYDRAALGLRGPFAYAVIKDEIASFIRWTQYDRFITARSRADGGFLAVTSGTFPDHLPQLLNVELDGSFTTLGTYDFGSESNFDGAGRCINDSSGGVSCNSAGLDCVLDASSALYCLTVLGDYAVGDSPPPVVVRYTRDAPPRIIHHGRDSAVKISAWSKLVTGP